MASMNDAAVKELLNGRYIASLASAGADGSIHVVAVWFNFDGTNIYVATASRSRKARNLQANAKVSLMVDSRDVAASRGITVSGKAQLLTGDLSRKRNSEIHGKYMSAAAIADPRVGPVFAGWDDVTIKITPEAVIAWDMRQADQQFFGGAFASNPGYLLAVEQ